MATRLSADLKKVLTDAGYADMGEVRLTETVKLKRQIGADRVTEIEEWFQANYDTPVEEFEAITLAGTTTTTEGAE